MSDVFAVAGAVEHALYGPTGVYHRLPPQDQQRLASTSIDVVERPTAEERAMIEGLKPSDHLLGLFTLTIHDEGGPGEHEAAQIQLFADEIAAVGYDPVDVAIHEIGHRLDYNHAHADAVVGLSAPDLQTIVVQDGSAEASCPICQVDSYLAQVEKNLDGLRQRSHLQHRIPLGLGGRIPEARRKLEAAQSALVLAAALVPDRTGEVRQLQGLMEQTGFALAGDRLTPEDISRAHALAYRTWDASYDLGHAYYLAALHGAGEVCPDCAARMEAA